MTKPTKPTVPPAPSRANPGPVFSQTADNFAAFQAPFADYLDALAEFVDERADEALAAALAGDLPPLTGQGGSFARAKPDGTAMEFRTPAQVRTDLSINGIGSETAPTVTNLNTLTVAGEYFSNPGATGAPNGTDSFSIKHYASNATSYAFQEVFSHVSGARWWRGEVESVWGAWTQVQPALGFTPVEQGGGANMGADKIRIGWSTSGTGLRLNVGGVDAGELANKADFSVLTPPAIAAQGTGSVGTYALLFNVDVTTNINPGATIAGSSLRYTSAGGYVSPGLAPPGTWRCMGYASQSQLSGPEIRITLYLRIA
jgi:hypothetical protein